MLENHQKKFLRAELQNSLSRMGSGISSGEGQGNSYSRAKLTWNAAYSRTDGLMRERGGATGGRASDGFDENEYVTGYQSPPIREDHSKLSRYRMDCLN